MSKDITFGEVNHPDSFIKQASDDINAVKKYSNHCPFNSQKWALFQIYVSVELAYWFVKLDKNGSKFHGLNYNKVYNFEKYFLAK